ncbi:MAG: hypothetical protein AB1Z98_23390 [Nannocystaceae bacterium]
MKTNTATLGLLIATVIGVYAQPSLGSAQVTAASEDSGAIELEGEWSLAERSTWEQIYADRMQYLNLMNSTCGTSITMSFDHAAFRDRLPSVDANRNEDWSASAMITAIRNLCLEGEMQRATVAEKIGSIEFVRAPGKRHRRRGKKLVIALDLEANPREHVNAFSAWLARSL